MNQTVRIFVFVVFILCLSSCANIPQVTKDSLYTEAANTIVVQLTETAAALPPTVTVFVPVEISAPTPTTPVILIPSAVTIIQSTPTNSITNPYQVEFVSAEPSPNQFTPGQTFTLTWRLKNIGTATWSGKYVFAFNKKGIQLANQSSYAINTVVAPGETLVISMPAIAPSDYGTYQTEWSFSTPEGIRFYYVYYSVIVGDTTFITSEPTVTITPSSLSWMCTNSERSNVQGSGCEEFCSINKLSLNNEGQTCYVFGSAR